MSKSNPTLPPGTASEADFPIERSESENLTRREFAKFLTLVSGGMAVGSGWVAVKDKVVPPFTFPGEQFVCEASQITRGGTHPFMLEGSKIPYILIHLTDGTFRAFEQKCTHLACAVYYSPDSGKIECPCHKGSFDARTGSVLAGPPPRPLPRLEVVQREGKLFVRAPHHGSQQPSDPQT